MTYKEFTIEKMVTYFEDYLCNVVGLDIDDFDYFMSAVGNRYSDGKDKEIAVLKAEIERKDNALREAQEIIERKTGLTSFAIEQVLPKVSV